MGTDDFHVEQLTINNLPLYFEHLSQVAKQIESNHDDVHFTHHYHEAITTSDSLFAQITNGIRVDFGHRGWRHIWIALDNDNHILGHAELKSNECRLCKHRIQLNITAYPANPLVTSKLLICATDFCFASDNIEWIDLFLLSEKNNDIDFYLNHGFKTSEVNKDTYRIQGESYDESHLVMNMK
ncbi:hypothetical protein CS022_23920 [Veronia nyctiphanis]|uniref:N-acetyltransferase domain-containing protein n=1 Tax=Veronia nyctiphanis TaxID=1278244 RepID=A0A4Q0YF33_9GAMM|nr:hypothetical protein [Veronia nyctiphanis]RXJ69102.1 hypothetical protein CS022_23920 [Veronia nyctiphanis]